MNARIDIATPTLANQLRDQYDALKRAAQLIGDARADIPIVSDARIDSRRRALVDQIMRLESALWDLATDVRDSVEDP